MPCNPKNSCAGGYGNCLDVKITNSCNGSCAFCIEKDGYCPNPTDYIQLALQTVAQSEFDTVLILGGEPTMHANLVDYIKLIRPYKKKIFMTTNGSLLKQPYVDVDELAENLDGLNISLHHYTEQLNDRVYRGGSDDAPHGKPNIHISFDLLKNAIAICHRHNTPVRLNVNLVKGYMETKADVQNMIQLAKFLGADEIRFSELQNCPDLYVDARTMFSGLPSDPFTQGCEVPVFLDPAVKTMVKITCGRVNPNKPPVNEKPIRVGKTRVIYPNASVFPGWKTASQTRVKNCHQKNCHGSDNNYCDGCHTGCH